MRGRIGGSKGGEGMVNDNNAVGDQTVTLPALRGSQAILGGGEIKVKMIKLSSIHLEKKHKYLR